VNGEPVRTSWFGANQKRPKLPYYFRPTKRLKGLDEFDPPEFVGRMARVERRRKLGWYAMLAGAVALGVAIGLFLI
jgi:hypothetical protein